MGFSVICPQKLAILFYNIPSAHSEGSIGSLVYLKKEGDKFQARDFYIVVDIKGNLAIIQKITTLISLKD